MSSKSDLFARLQKEILSIQGFRPVHGQCEDQSGLGKILSAFPENTFPFSGVHEFLFNSQEAAAASGAFVTALLSGRMKKGSVALWVSTGRMIFPPALLQFGVQPEQVIFLQLKNEREVVWAVEEALQCHALTAVIGEIPALSFTASRRFQLAIERTGVSCFVLRQRPKNLATACVARWQVQPLPSHPVADLPGVHHPCWKVDLLKVRNGKTGTWELEWANNRFRHVPAMKVLPQQWQRKTG
jgi:protein ImuA